MNELFASMPFKNAFDLLSKMPNGLLARNVQKMINGIKEVNLNVLKIIIMNTKTMKNNKLNEEDCGLKLAISEGGFIAKHSDPNDFNSVRALFPILSINLLAINKPIISFYYEVQILNKLYCAYPIIIGFCEKQFPLEGNWLGREYNTIGCQCSHGMFIGGTWIKIGNDNAFFEEGDFVGLGIIHQPNSEMECFATCNGKLMGKYKLPSKFVYFQLFATINLYASDDSIRVNFGKEKWIFDEFGRVLE